MQDSTGKVILNASTQPVPLNPAGSISVVLPCTDNADFNPANFSYLVTEVIPGLGRAYYVQLPHASAPGLLPAPPDARRPVPNSTQQNAYYGAQSTGKCVLYDALGNVIATGINMPVGAASGYVLTSDASGNATWQAAIAANLAGGATLPAYLAPKVVTLTFAGGGTTLVDASLGNAFNLTLTASTTTLGNPSNAVDGEVIRFRVTQGSGGNFTLAYGANYDFGTAGSPTLSTTAAKVDVLGFEYVASLAKWCYLGSGLGF